MERTTDTMLIEMLDSAPTTPQHDNDAPILAIPDEKFRLQYEGPLYTEINIPLPSLPIPSKPSSPASQASAIKSESRGRSRTLSSLSAFRHRRSSSSASSLSLSHKSNNNNARDSEEWPRIRKDVVKSREVNAMMDLRHQNKRGRSGTIDALAVVPAVLVLSAELFTPGVKEDGEGKEGRRKDSGVGRWEDGIR